MKEKLTLEELKGRNDYYLLTVESLLCFISFATWEKSQETPNIAYSFGRRLTTSSANRNTPNTDVTPDSIIQIDTDLGLIIEVKATLPINQNYWKEYLIQIEKYDDNLKGWWTQDGFIENYNVILLIHTARHRDFRSYRNQLLNEGKIIRSENICAVEFHRSSDLFEYIYFGSSWENINDPILSAKLDSGKLIPLEKVKTAYGHIKFYDTPPEVEYLLSIIWQNQLTRMREHIEFNKELKCWPIKVDVQALTSELQASFGSIALQKSCGIDNNSERETEYPTFAWVRKALDVLVELKLAVNIDQDHYKVFFRLLRTEIIEYFSKHRTIKKKKQEDEDQKQPLLFNKS